MKNILIVMLCLILQSCASGVQHQELMQSKAYFSAGDYKKAFHASLPLAAAGNAQGEYALGYMYYYGYGVAQDTDTGIFWMQKAAMQHYDPAIKGLAAIAQNNKPENRGEESRNNHR